MEEEVRKKIEEIIGQMRCPKNFRCAESDFENLCKAEDIGMDRHLLCLDNTPSRCLFSLVFDKHYCACPLRIYLAKHLGK